MHLTDASVAIHPRNPWEALDLGVLLARQHRGLLMASWALVTLPIFALLSLVLWDYPTTAIVLFWWLKPVYERLPLIILSQALFGPAPNLKTALHIWLKTLRPGLLASLTWRRMSLSRSFLQPVQQLENLSGTVLARRRALLSQKDLRAARSLTAVGSALEIGLWSATLVLFYALIPQQVEIDWQWLMKAEVDHGLSWLQHLTNLFYAGVLVIWGPVYVSCGFTLYLNRRTVLEAWDIELVLRRMRQRLCGSTYALMMGVTLALSGVAQPVLAAEQDFSCPVPQFSVADEADPDSPRLMHQTLNSEAAQQQINALLQQPPFKNPHTLTGWRFPEREQLAPAAPAAENASLLFWLNKLLQLGSFLAQVFKVLLWGIVIALIGLIIWRYKAWITTLISPPQKPDKPRHIAPEQLFGLQVSAQSLPADVARSAEKLWSSQPRQALGLLYRALLSRLISDYRLPLGNADTEGQVLERIAQLDQPLLHEYSRSLTSHWQNLAYGQQLPQPQVQQELCDGWRRLFDGANSP